MVGTASHPLQIGGPEWLWIVLIAVVLLFGPSKLPGLARALGKAMGEFQRGRAEIEREIREMSKSPPPGASSDPQRARLLLVARDLGIDSTGKNDAELKEEITKRLG